MSTTWKCVRGFGIAAIGLLVGLLSATVWANTPVTGAGFTTVNEGVDGTGHCKNGNPAVNCNIYDGKQYVWLNGGPSVAYVGDGDYFFAVLAPGGQNDPNDGGANNLSDDFDTYLNRKFSVSGGTVTYGGTHDFDSNKIRLMPYADTTNPGGVYIMAICSLADGYPADPSDCKYDAFKVLPANAASIKACKFNDLDGNGINDAGDPLLPLWKITAYGLTDPSDLIGSSQITDETGCVNFTVTNLNGPIILAETLQDGWLQTAPFTGGTYTGYTGDDNGFAIVNVPLTAGQEVIVYFGNYNVREGGGLAIVKTVNPKIEYSWNIAKSVDNTKVTQTGGTATFNYTVGVQHNAGSWTLSGDITISNSTVLDLTGLKITDIIDNNGNCTIDPLGNGTASGNSVTGIAIGKLSTVSMKYSCTFDPNTMFAPTGTNKIVLYLSDDTQKDSDDEAYDFATGKFVDECVNVTDSYAGALGTVCVGDANPTSFTYQRTVPVPPHDCVSYDNTATFTTNDTGATGSASKTVEVCRVPVKTGALTMGFWQNPNGQGIIKNSGPSYGTCAITAWLRAYAPFADLSSTATCTQVATYVTNVIKAASAAGSSMNAMLKAQMLATALDVYFSDPALGGNKINAPVPIGGVVIDLQNICKDIAACTIYEDTSSAFGGATSLSVAGLLTYAASQSNPGGTTWYGQVKATQELAKDTFDAINNQKAFTP